MTQPNLLASGVRTDGQLAGVFEYDGETGYFYLHALRESAGNRVRGAIHVLSGRRDFESQDVEIRWDPTETVVGLFIRHQVWAVFDTRNGASYGGDYEARVGPQLPANVLAAMTRS